MNKIKVFSICSLGFILYANITLLFMSLFLGFLSIIPLLLFKVPLLFALNIMIKLLLLLNLIIIPIGIHFGIYSAKTETK